MARVASLFEITQTLVMEVEGLVLKSNSSNKFIHFVKRYLFFPFKFLRVGINEFLKPFTLWAIISAVVFIPISIYLFDEKAPLELRNLWAIVSLVVPISMVLFALPSTYAYSGATPKMVSKVATLLVSLEIDSEDKIKSLTSNLEKILERAHARVRTLRWIVGAFWAFTIFILGQINAISLKIGTIDVNTMFLHNLQSLVICAAITIMALWIFTSYKKAIDLTFKTIEFACAEVNFSIARLEKEQ